MIFDQLSLLRFVYVSFSCILHFITGSLFKIRNLEFCINWPYYSDISFLYLYINLILCFCFDHLCN